MRLCHSVGGRADYVIETKIRTIEESQREPHQKVV